MWMICTVIFLNKFAGFQGGMEVCSQVHAQIEGNLGPWTMQTNPLCSKTTSVMTQMRICHVWITLQIWRTCLMYATKRLETGGLISWQLTSIRYAIFYAAVVVGFSAVLSKLALWNPHVAIQKCIGRGRLLDEATQSTFSLLWVTQMCLMLSICDPSVVNWFQRSSGGGAFKAVDLLNDKMQCGYDGIDACQARLNLMGLPYSQLVTELNTCA